MPSEHASAELLGAMSKLLTSVRDVTLRLEVDGVDAARGTQAKVADQLSDYVLPRLVQLDAPLLAVVGGSTGAGKSTLVNSLVGERVTESGVLRPTTRSPVLVHHPDDAEWFLPDRILPDLPRTDVPTNDTYALAARDVRRRSRAVSRSSTRPTSTRSTGATASSPPSSSPPPTCGSSSPRRRAMPTRCRGTTSARRPSAARRSPSSSTGRRAEAVIEVRGHLARMMTSRGLSDSPLFTVPESGVDADGLLPRDAVSPIVGLAARARRRSAPPARWSWLVRSTAPSATSCCARTTSPTRWTPRSRRQRCCTATSTRPTARRSTRSRCRSPTARCSRARCWRAGRSSSAPASCCAPSRRRSAASATASSTA